MTKPLPTGWIKDDDDLSWKKFNYLLQKVSLDGEIRHLYVVDIEFEFSNAIPEQSNNEIYLPIVEKQNTMC